MALLSYVLPALAVLAVATVVTVVALGALRLSWAATSAVVARTPVRGWLGTRKEVARRCEACGRSWASDGRSDPGVVVLRLRRSVRRRRRDEGHAVPGWAAAQGWSRCPSCLSTRVRTSGDAWLPSAKQLEARRLTTIGLVVAGAGAAVLGVSLLGALNR